MRMNVKHKYKYILHSINTDDKQNQITNTFFIMLIKSRT